MGRLSSAAYQIMIASAITGHPWDSEATTEQGLQNTGNFSWHPVAPEIEPPLDMWSLLFRNSLLSMAQTDKVAYTYSLP